MKIEKKEGSNITYKDDKISVIGQSFKFEASLPSSQLMSLYTSGKGRTVVTLTVEVPDAQPTTEQPTSKKITINNLIDELANKGLSEDEIMNTEVTL